MKRKVQKIGSAILCMALLGNAIAGSIPNGQVQAAQEYKEVYYDNFEDGKTYDTREGNMTSSNVVEVKTNHYLKYTVTGLASLKSAPVTVVGGRQYQLTYRVNVPEANGSVHYWPIYQEWSEATNEWSQAITTSTPASCEIKTKTDGWVEHSMNFTPSEGKDHVHFFFEQSWSGYAEIWLDDIVIRDTETQEVVYSEDFSTTQSFGVQDGNSTLTQSWEKEELHDYALKLEGASNGYAVKTSGIKVESGAEYKLTYKLRVSNVTGSIHFWPMYQEWKTDAAGAESGYTGTITVNTPENCKWTKATDGWVEQEMPITISNDNNNIQFFFELAWSGTADVELDDITFTKVSDGTVVFKQDFTTKTELTVHASGFAGTQTFTEQGNHCLSLSGMGSVKTPPIRLENGKKYILSYRAKVENVNDSIYFRPMYQEWYNDGGSIDTEYTVHYFDDCVVQEDTNGWVDIQTQFSFTERRNMIQFFFEQPWSGTADIYIDDVKILEGSDTSRRVETKVSFKKIETDNSWRFDVDNLSEMTAKYYVTTMKIDGEDRRVYVENDGTQLVVWPNFFQDAKLPTSQLEIPAGTELSEVTSDLTLVPDGEKVTITNALKLVCIDNAWSAYDKETTSTRYVNLDAQKEGTTISGTTQTTPGTYTEKYIQTETNTQVGTTAATIDSANTPVTFTSWQSVTAETWSFTIDESISFSSSPQYYKIPVMVDGESTYVAIQFENKKKNGIIYAQEGWFGVYGSHIPKKSIKFAAGAVMKQVTPTDNWPEVEGGKVLQLTKDFELLFEKVLVNRTSALYKTGDVHMGQEYNSMDLVAMKKVAANTSDKTTDLAALRAADVNGSDTVDATDLSALRGHLVGKFDIRYDSKINAAYSGVMPIIGYDAPDYDAASIDSKGREANGYEVNFITDEIYAMVKDMGFNTVVANRNEIGGADNIAYDTLKLTEKYGLKAYIWNAYVSDPDNKDKVTDKEALDAINQKYEKYNSFLGYYICDEPKKNAIAKYKTPFELLQNYTNLSGYMNLYPCNSGTLRWELEKNLITGVMKESNYKGYLNVANENGTDFLSYDMYLRDNSYHNVKEAFYTNLKWSNDVAKKNGKPFYAFVQVGTDFEEDNENSTPQEKLTTVQEMYLEANAALAMGAKGLNYYSLIQPIKFANNSKDEYDLYRCGLINIEGKPNHGENGKSNYDYYNAAKKINTYVAKIDEVLMNAEHKAVISTDEDVKKWVSQTTSYASLTGVTSMGTTLVGCFDYYGREAYLVVNTSCDGGDVGNSQDVTLNFNTNASYSYVGMDCKEYKGFGTLNLSNLGSGESVLVVMD